VRRKSGMRVTGDALRMSHGYHRLKKGWQDMFDVIKDVKQASPLNNERPVCLERVDCQP
jgi:hypothetical protein